MHEDDGALGASLLDDGSLCRRVLDGIEDHAIMTVDADGVFTGWSVGAERVFGYHREQILGRHLAVAFTEEDRARGADGRELATAVEQERVEGEVWQVRADGSRFWGRCLTFVLRDAEGRVSAFARVVRDASEARRNRERLAQEAARRAELHALQEELAREALDSRGLMDRIVERTRALTRAHGAVLALLEGDELIYRAAAGTAMEHLGTRLHLDRSLSGWSVRTGRVLHVADALADGRADADVVRRVGIRSLIAVPLFHGGRPVGVLKVHSPEVDVFGPDDVETLELMAGFFGAALARGAERSRLQATLDALPVGVALGDASGRVVAFNPAMGAIWGGDPPLAESIGQYDQFRAWWPETGRPVEAHEWGMARAVTAGEASGPDEMDIERFDGERRTILNYARPIRDGSGLLLGAVAVNVDITERQAARERLRLFESVVASARDAVVVTEAEPIDRPGPRIVYVNDAFAAMTGYAPEEAIGRDPRFLQGPETDPEATASMRRALEAVTPFRVEVVNYRKDGAPFWVEIDLVPVRDARGRLTHWASVQRDTTARREQEEAALRLERERAAAAEAAEGRRRIEAILESITDAFVAVDRDWRFTYVNRRAAEYMGRDRDALIGGVLWEEFPILQGSLCERPIRRSMADRAALRFEAHAEHLNAWFEVRGYPTEEGFSLYLHDVTARHLAEEALRRTKEDLESLIAASPIAIVAFDVRGNVEIWNPSAERLFGWRADEVVGGPPPSTEARLLEIERELGRAKEGDILAGYEVDCVRKDGTTVGVSVSTAVLRGVGGGLRGVLAMVEDVTARREAADAQRRLAAILEGTTDLVATTDLRGDLLYLNRAGREMIDAGGQDPIGRNFVDFLPDWAAARVLTEGIPTALRLGSWRGEAAVLGPGGREIPVSQVITAHRGAGDEVAFLSTVVRDMSERKRTEEAQRFLSEASRVLSGSLEYDEVLRIVLNLAVPRLADFAFIDLVGEDGEIRRAAARHHDPAQQGLLDELRRFPAGRGRAFGTIVALRDGRSERVAEVTPMWLRALSSDEAHLRLLKALDPRSELAVPLRVRGRIIGAITFGCSGSGRRYEPEDVPVAEDLASRAALALDNALLLRATREAVRTRDEVLRIVAHDLRSPITTISLTAGAMLEGEMPGECTEARTDLVRITRSAERAQRLIADLLDLARLQTGRLTLQRAPVAPATLVEESVDLHRPQAAEKKIALETRVDVDLPVIAADRDRLLQVLDNLLVNAIKFTPEGGHVEVRARAVDGVVRFAVSDTGPGSPPEQLAHFFDPFWQERTTARDGAGLGLTICRGLVEAHGGRIDVESEEGRGTTFRFTVPLGEKARYGAQTRES
jgi:PAS domain S-box-containing protein